MEEVGCHDLDGMSLPGKEVLVTGRDVKYFACNIPEECCDLACHDLMAHACHGVKVDPCWVVGGCLDLVCPADYV